MKAEIWCRSDSKRTDVKAVRAWVGEIPFVPREGDYLCLWDGWALATVLRGSFNCYDGTVDIEITPDYTGEYADKARKEGINP